MRRANGRALTTDLDRFVCGSGRHDADRPHDRSHHITPARLPRRHFSVSILASRIRKNDLVRQSATAGSMGARQREKEGEGKGERERERGQWQHRCPYAVEIYTSATGASRDLHATMNMADARIQYRKLIATRLRLFVLRTASIFVT